MKIGTLVVLSMLQVTRVAFADSFDEQLQLAYQEAIAKSGVDAGRAGTSPHNIYEQHPFGSDIAVLFFYEDGNAIFPLPQVDENDRLVIVVVPESSVDLKVVKIVPINCTQGQDVRVGGAILPALGKGIPAPPAPRYRILIAENCGSEQGFKATISLHDTKADSDKPSTTVALSTLALHRITVALGIVYNFSPVTDYRAEAVKGESVPVIVQDNHRLGVNAIATVSLRLFKVDNVRPRQWWQIVIPAPTIGISLSSPLDHVYLALVFEPYPGVGIIGGYDIHTRATLAGGYNVGDRIPGGQVPIDKRWTADGQDWLVGVNLDASIFTKILSLVSK